MSHEHTTGDNDYEVTLDRSFASSCTITDRKSGTKRTLYEQDRGKPVDVQKGGHSKKHRIVLKGRNGKRRNITITIDDPEHAIHGITLDLYEEGRDPRKKGDWGATETFSIKNHAHTCPPYCEG